MEREDKVIIVGTIIGLMGFIALIWKFIEIW